MNEKRKLLDTKETFWRQMLCSQQDTHKPIVCVRPHGTGPPTMMMLVNVSAKHLCVMFSIKYYESYKLHAYYIGMEHAFDDLLFAIIAIGKFAQRMGHSNY